ncbi:unnamed protein product [Phaeothamnion confervicola]
MATAAAAANVVAVPNLPPALGWKFRDLSMCVTREEWASERGALKQPCLRWAAWLLGLLEEVGDVAIAAGASRDGDTKTAAARADERAAEARREAQSELELRAFDALASCLESRVCNGRVKVLASAMLCAHLRAYERRAAGAGSVGLRTAGSAATAATPPSGLRRIGDRSGVVVAGVTLPMLQRLRRITNAVLALCKREKQSGRLFLPPPLLRMVDLAVAAVSALAAHGAAQAMSAAAPLLPAIADAAARDSGGGGGDVLALPATEGAGISDGSKAGPSERSKGGRSVLGGGDGGGNELSADYAAVAAAEAAGAQVVAGMVAPAFVPPQDGRQMLGWSSTARCLTEAERPLAVLSCSAEYFATLREDLLPHPVDMLRLWLSCVKSPVTIESAHPLMAVGTGGSGGVGGGGGGGVGEGGGGVLCSASVSDIVHIPDAHAMEVFFDSRCALPSGVTLTLTGASMRQPAATGLVSPWARASGGGAGSSTAAAVVTGVGGGSSGCGGESAGDDADAGGVGADGLSIPAVEASFNKSMVFTGAEERDWGRRVVFRGSTLRWALSDGSSGVGNGSSGVAASGTNGASARMSLYWGFGMTIVPKGTRAAELARVRLLYQRIVPSRPPWFSVGGAADTSDAAAIDAHLVADGGVGGGGLPVGAGVGDDAVSPVSSGGGGSGSIGDNGRSGRALLKAMAADVAAVLRGWTVEMDRALVDWINEQAEQSGGTGAGVSPYAFRPRARDLAFRYKCLADAPRRTVHLRVAMLQQFNSDLQKALPLVDLMDRRPGSLGARLRGLSHAVFRDLKLRLLEAAKEKTRGSGGSSTTITLDNFLASRSVEAGETGIHASRCVFAQAFRALQGKSCRVLRSCWDGDRVFQVTFRGERGSDAGGVFREAMSRIVEDLFSPSNLDLLSPCPNALHGLHVNTDKYVPNPRHRGDPLAAAMLEFVGKLMGVSLRTHLCLPFQLPSVVWKALVGQAATLEDVEAYDALAVRLAAQVRRCEEFGIADEASFRRKFGDALRFVCVGSDGAEAELVPSGRNVPVTYASRMAYCALLERHVLGEMEEPLAAIARGMAGIMPPAALQLLTWRELETLVCGDPVFDLEFWRAHTTYSGYAADDPTVRYFWEVIASLSPEEQSGFVRFAWGRSRLPPKSAWFKDMQVSRRNAAEDTLPVSHTCFFSVEIPVYTSVDRCRQNLLTAIHFGGGILNV